MTGYCSDTRTPGAAGPRRYTVVPRGEGWSISLNGACTHPFASKRAAHRIAAALQRQADALRGRRQ